MLDKLVKFAKSNYPELSAADDEVLRLFFYEHRKTTLVRLDSEGSIDGFFVYVLEAGQKVFILACLQGDRQKNIRDMKQLAKKLRPLNILMRKGNQCLRL